MRELEALLEAARTSRGGALVLRGEAGSGKSALLTEASASAAGLRVLRTQGIESESPLAYAALHRLLLPVYEGIARLPARQARALREIFGEEEPVPADPAGTDRFLVFLAVLSLLAEAAEQEPVLCVIDDAHWLDEASAAALLFVARRLEAERIALLFAARDGDRSRFDSGDLPVLQVAGLGREAAEALLQEQAKTRVPPAVLGRLVEMTGGNPLALLELPESLSAGQLLGEAALPEHLPLTEGVEQVFLDRCRSLSEEAQRLLLVAAADDSGRLATICRAAALLDAGDEAMAEAERSGLLQVAGAEVQLRHPLVRSAIYNAAASADRRRTHQVLAQAMIDLQDAERRVWHSAAATIQPDDRIAGELDGIARRAAQRGGHGAAAAAWERAAELTTAQHLRARRLQDAGQSLWLAGQPNRARTLAQAARRQTEDPVLLADIDRLRARIEWNLGSVQVGHGILMRAAADVAGVDPGRAREMAMIGTALAVSGGDSGIGIDPASFVGPLHGDEPEETRCFTQLLLGLDRVRRADLAGAAPLLRDAIASSGGLHDTDLLSNLGVAALLLGDDASALDVHGRLLGLVRDHSAVSLILYALTRRAFAQAATGQWPALSSSSEEALDLARGMGQPALALMPMAWLVWVAAVRGDDDYKDRLAELERALQGGHGGILIPHINQVLHCARGAAAGFADPARALGQLEQVTAPWERQLVALDAIEAAARAGSTGQLREWTGNLEHFAAATGQPWAHAAAAHARALDAESDGEEHFQRALGHHARSTRPFNRARTQLAYGEFLRRSRRRVDAREQLRGALTGFEELGARIWADRAREELRASGETARRRDNAADTTLTAQELQVVRRVQEGLTNREVAALLFVSPRTVDFHLRNVFTKLGISSRSALLRLDLAQAAS